MNLRSLRYFLKVAERSSLTKAAGDLHITQPALSRHLSQLEDHFQVPLLMRHGRGVKLTEAGLLLRERADDLLSKFEDLNDELQARTTKPQGELAVGMPTSWTNLITLPLLATFRRLYPDVRIRMVMDASAALADALKLRDIHAAILTDIDHDPDFVSTPLVRDGIMLVAPPDADLPQARQVTLRELSKHPMILPLYSTVGRRKVEQALAREGLRANWVIETNVPAIIPLISMGLGYATMPACALTGHATPLNVKMAPIADLGTTWTLSVPKTRPRTAAIAAFEDMVRRLTRDAVQTNAWPTAALI